MGTCLICHKEVFMHDSLILSGEEARRLKITLPWGEGLPFIHPLCIDLPEVLDSDHQMMWLLAETKRQKEVLKEQSFLLQIIKRAILDLPEGFASTAKDEIEHLESTYKEELT